MSNHVGVNITKLICEAVGCRYLNHAAFHIVRVSGESYTIYSTHGSAGARLPWTKIKSAIDLFRSAEAEIVLMGHTHGLDAMTQLFQVIDKKRKKLDYFKRHAVLTGSYLRFSGSYAEQKNLPPVPLGSPIITLYGDHHEIRVSI